MKPDVRIDLGILESAVPCSLGTIGTVIRTRWVSKIAAQRPPKFLVGRRQIVVINE